MSYRETSAAVLGIAYCRITLGVRQAFWKVDLMSIFYILYNNIMEALILSKSHALAADSIRKYQKLLYLQVQTGARSK